MSLILWCRDGAEALKAKLGGAFPSGLDLFIWDADDLPEVEAGDVVVAYGARHLNALVGAGVVQKKRTVTSLREQPHAYPNDAQVFVTWSPGLADLEPKRLPELRWDTQLAVRYLRTGSTLPQYGQYEWVPDLSQFCSEVEAKYKATGRPVFVGHDLETVGDLYASSGRILTTQWSHAKGTAVLVRFDDGDTLSPALEEQIEWLISTEKIILGGANHKGDSIWMMRRWKKRPLNLKFDAVLIGSLVDENRSNSLNMLTKVYAPMLGGYDDEFNRLFDKSRMDLALQKDPDRFRLYGGGDVDALHHIREPLLNELKADKQLTRFYVRLLMPASRAFERVENRGLLVDEAEFARLATELGTKDGEVGVIPDLKREFRSLLPPRVRAKYKDNLSPSRPALIRDTFFGLNPEEWTGGSNLGFGLRPVGVRKGQPIDYRRPPVGVTEKPDKKTGLPVPSTSMKHLVRHYSNADARALIDCLSHYNSATKTQNTYVDGFLKYLREDKRFHAFYFLFKGFDADQDEDGGANTGRTSAKGPAVQTLPKHTRWAKALRRCYPAPPGQVILQWDFSQGELRIAGCLADEKNILAAYAEGKDLHAVTASKLLGLGYEMFLALEISDPDRYNAARSRAKAGNFGLLYGMSAEGFVEYARNAYGVILTLAEAEKIRDDFFALYTGLEPWYLRQHRFAERFEFVRGPLGRVRHLPMIHSRDGGVRSKARRQSVNSVVQGTLSDMCLWSIALVEERYPDAELTVGMTHDSILAYAPESEALFWAREVKQVMETLPFEDLGWKPQLKFPVDVEMSKTTLADLKKLSPEALAA